MASSVKKNPRFIRGFFCALVERLGKERETIPLDPASTDEA
jgi:hypothetical protein